MTDNHKSQSEKLAVGGGRETAAEKQHDKKVPGPHRSRDASTWAAGAGADAPTPRRARARDPGSSGEAHGVAQCPLVIVDVVVTGLLRGAVQVLHRARPAATPSSRGGPDLELRACG